MCPTDDLMTLNLMLVSPKDNQVIYKANDKKKPQKTP